MQFLSVSRFGKRLLNCWRQQGFGTRAFHSRYSTKAAESSHGLSWSLPGLAPSLSDSTSSREDSRSEVVARLVAGLRDVVWGSNPWGWGQGRALRSFHLHYSLCSCRYHSQNEDRQCSSEVGWRASYSHQIHYYSFFTPHYRILIGGIKAWEICFSLNWGLLLWRYFRGSSRIMPFHIAMLMTQTGLCRLQYHHHSFLIHRRTHSTHLKRLSYYYLSDFKLCQTSLYHWINSGFKRSDQLLMRTVTVQVPLRQDAVAVELSLLLHSTPTWSFQSTSSFLEIKKCWSCYSCGLTPLYAIMNFGLHFDSFLSCRL